MQHLRQVVRPSKSWARPRLHDAKTFHAGYSTPLRQWLGAVQQAHFEAVFFNLKHQPSAAVRDISLTTGRNKTIPPVHMGVVRSAVDLEKGRGKPNLYGFASVAALVARDPDKSGTIYRRFDRLSARTLLYLESKLAVLESTQERFDEEDGTNDSFALKSAATSWEEFEEHAKDSDRPEIQKRMNLATEIATTLKTYHEALYWNSQVLNLPRPETHTLKACRTMLRKDGYDTLQGVARERLDDKNDLCSLVEPQQSDTVSKLLLNHFPLLFKTKGTGTDVIFTSSRRLSNWVSGLATVLAFGLLFGAIEALYGQLDHRKKLGTLAGFVLAFAFCISCFTDAKRADVFAATAAYAAVLVVYVGNNNNNNN